MDKVNKFLKNIALNGEKKKMILWIDIEIDIFNMWPNWRKLLFQLLCVREIQLIRGFCVRKSKIEYTE